MKDYLPNTLKLLRYYKQLGERTFEQLEDVELFWQPNKDTNSIAILVNHLSGNMLSRWTNFLTEDGEKDWRNRDQEFENKIRDRKELYDRWNVGWTCFLRTLESIGDDDLNKTIYIRHEPQSVADAIQRQLAHYSMHVGQIVLLGKMQKGANWQSLSIPKGQSIAYNQKKQNQAPEFGKHFTERV